MTFVEQYLAGKVGVENIDDFVDNWHLSEFERPLCAFLGFTAEEYCQWIENPDCLKEILNARGSYGQEVHERIKI